MQVVPGVTMEPTTVLGERRFRSTDNTLDLTLGERDAVELGILLVWTYHAGIKKGKEEAADEHRTV